MILPVILSGGSGHRLWPLSTTQTPKQFLPLLTKKTLFQEIIDRLSGLKNVTDPLIVCNQDHGAIVTKQLKQINVQASSVILEPVGRNTAPAITIAALQAIEIFGDPILLILPSDHIVTKQRDFQQFINSALVFAKNNKLITFGIVPTHPETGYGYIKSGKSLNGTKNYEVDSFVEKPNIELAKKYLVNGDYYWNSGIFMFKASALLTEMEKYSPDILQSCCAAFDNIVKDNYFSRLNKAKFSLCPSDSIDYAIMEKTSNAVVVSMNVGWSDIGSWDALAKINKADDEGNIKLGNVVAHNVANSYLRAENRHLAVIGVDDVIVIETKDAVLVAHKNSCQDVKLVAEPLKTAKS